MLYPLVWVSSLRKLGFQLGSVLGGAMTPSLEPWGPFRVVRWNASWSLVLIKKASSDATPVPTQEESEVTEIPTPEVLDSPLPVETTEPTSVVEPQSKEDVEPTGETEPAIEEAPKSKTKTPKAVKAPKVSKSRAKPTPSATETPSVSETPQETEVVPTDPTPSKPKRKSKVATDESTVEPTAAPAPKPKVTRKPRAPKESTSPDVEVPAKPKVPRKPRAPKVVPAVEEPTELEVITPEVAPVATEEPVVTETPLDEPKKAPTKRKSKTVVKEAVDATEAPAKKPRVSKARAKEAPTTPGMTAGVVEVSAKVSKPRKAAKSSSPSDVGTEPLPINALVLYKPNDHAMTFVSQGPTSQAQPNPDPITDPTPTPTPDPSLNEPTMDPPKSNWPQITTPPNLTGKERAPTTPMPTPTRLPSPEDEPDWDWEPMGYEEPGLFKSEEERLAMEAMLREMRDEDEEGPPMPPVPDHIISESLKEEAEFAYADKALMELRRQEEKEEREKRLKSAKKTSSKLAPKGKSSGSKPKWQPPVNRTTGTQRYAMSDVLGLNKQGGMTEDEVIGTHLTTMEKQRARLQAGAFRENRRRLLTWYSGNQNIRAKPKWKSSEPEATLNEAKPALPPLPKVKPLVTSVRTPRGDVDSVPIKWAIDELLIKSDRVRHPSLSEEDDGFRPVPILATSENGAVIYEGDPIRMPISSTFVSTYSDEHAEKYPLTTARDVPGVMVDKRTLNRSLVGLLTGLLLGCADVTPGFNGEPRLTVRAVGDNPELMYYYHSLLANARLCSLLRPEKALHTLVNGEEISTWQFDTWEFLGLWELIQLWYPLGTPTKTVPEAIHMYLTPLAIAAWAMVVCHPTPAPSGEYVSITFDLKRFDEVDAHHLIEALRVWRVDTILKEGYDSLELEVAYHSVPVLIQIIKPYLVTSRASRFGPWNYLFHVPVQRCDSALPTVGPLPESQLLFWVHMGRWGYLSPIALR
uniref:Homing endonuclease LAGLIDADG domain-containing protein n=1 Tax=Candida gigantensis TaxID=271359 RepID=S5TP44_9ASCO|nr:hypothetical protein [Candida gigantensis]AGS44565.1 hypothetical protein [Candida gigantensis]